MSDYLQQTKVNIEEKIRNSFQDEDDEEIGDQPPVNFIIDNFKEDTRNTFNVILAQRENDVQKITMLSIRIEQLKSTIDKLDTQKYQLCLENNNLKIEIEDAKKKNLKKSEEYKENGKQFEIKIRKMNELFLRIFLVNIVFMSLIPVCAYTLFG